jgi:predicted RNA-binding protein YlqC (UPF0109 family)
MTAVEPTTKSKAEQTLRTILEHLCKFTPDPSIRFADRTFVVQVDGRDQGRVIGRKGLNFWALNTAMWYAGLCAHGYPIRVQVLEPKERSRSPEMPFKPDPNWKQDKLDPLIKTLMTGCFGGYHHGFTVEHYENVCDGKVVIKGETYMPHTEPNIAEALSIIIRAAGMGIGALLTVEVLWV